MSRVGIIAAGGNSSRTGLGEYTTKAALPLDGKTLLARQIDFLRRSGVPRAIVVCRPHHARLLGQLLSDEDRRMAAFVLMDGPRSGWAGEVERAIAHVDEDDEVVLLSCDNLHEGVAAHLGSEKSALFTYTEWTGVGTPPSGALARVTTAWGRPDAETWIECQGNALDKGRAFFSGYAVCRGGILARTLREIAPITGVKEMTTLLELLARSPLCRATSYDGRYVDLADIPALAQAEAHLRGDGTSQAVTIGAGVLLCTGDLCKMVLLTEREDGLGWVPPCGIVEPGEAYAAAAIRETKEEIGGSIDEQNLRLLGVYATRGKAGEPAATVLFRANDVHEGRQAWMYDKTEVLDVRWFTREQAAQIEIPFGLRAAVEDVFAGRSLDAR